jgi:hypothetical protein
MLPGGRGKTMHTFWREVQKFDLSTIKIQESQLNKSAKT